MLKAKLGERAVLVASAGTHAYNGAYASAHTCDVLQEVGIDCSSHRSARLNQEVIDAFDLIFCMTKGHMNDIEKRFVLKKDTLKWIGDLTDCGDVSDPFAGSLQDYKNTYMCLESAIEKIRILIEEK